MKQYVRIILCAILLSSLFVLPSCRVLDFHRMPSKFPNTTWFSDNGTVEISFTVQEDAVIRFSGQWKTAEDEYLDMMPMYANEYGVICIEDLELKFFVSEEEYRMTLISEKLPFVPEENDDWFSCLEKYTLLSLSVDYNSSKHFVATVEASKIDEIPVGTVLDFYRIDSK